MQLLAFPYLSDPNGVVIGGVCCDDVAQAAGHICRAIQQDPGQDITLAGDRLAFADQSVHFDPFSPDRP